MDISTVVNTKEFAAYWREQPALTYFGETKFAYRKQRDSSLKYIKGAEQAPVVMSLTNNDANSIGLSYGEFEVVEHKLPRFKNHYTIDEDLIKMLADVDANATDAQKAIIAKIFDRSNMLRKNAALTREVLRMQALTTGVAAMANNGASFSIDYKVPSSHKGSPTVKWDTTTTADPIADIEDWMLTVATDTGVKPTEILMNSTTLGKMRKIDSIKNGYFANTRASGVPTSAQVKQYLMDSLSVDIYVDDDVYKDINGTTKKMVPDGTVVLMPEGDLGFGVFGTTPEELRLKEAEIVDMGVALVAWDDKDSVASFLKAAQEFLPSFERADEIFIASVLTAS